MNKLAINTQQQKSRYEPIVGVVQYNGMLVIARRLRHQIEHAVEMLTVQDRKDSLCLFSQQMTRLNNGIVQSRIVSKDFKLLRGSKNLNAPCIASSSKMKNSVFICCHLLLICFCGAISVHLIFSDGSATFLREGTGQMVLLALHIIKHTEMGNKHDKKEQPKNLAMSEAASDSSPLAAEDQSYTEPESALKNAFMNGDRYRMSLVNPDQDPPDPDEELKQINVDSCRISKKSPKQLEFSQQNGPLMQGVLFKLSTANIFGTDSQRYCELHPNKFIYRQSAAKDSPKAGILNFQLLSCAVAFSCDSYGAESLSIKVNKSEKQFIFRAQQKGQTRLWADKLKEITAASAGNMLKLTYLSHYHRFWRKQCISESEFRANAQTGDLVLMRGTSQSAVMQRAFTQEEYDHIAVVVKNVKQEVLLFEANSAFGVSLLSWERFIDKDYYKSQEIVTYRHLEIERTQQFLTGIQEFLACNIGKKYKFTLKKMLINRQSSTENQKITFFCSSLVAKLYKTLGLLDEKVSSSQYMPSSFTEKQNTRLKCDGKFGKAALGEQKYIVFEKEFFSQ